MAYAELADAMEQGNNRVAKHEDKLCPVCGYCSWLCSCRKDFSPEEPMVIGTSFAPTTTKAAFTMLPLLRFTSSGSMWFEGSAHIWQCNPAERSAVAIAVSAKNLHEWRKRARKKRGRLPSVPGLLGSIPGKFHACRCWQAPCLLCFEGTTPCHHFVEGPSGYLPWGRRGSCTPDRQRFVVGF